MSAVLLLNLSHILFNSLLHVFKKYNTFVQALAITRHYRDHLFCVAVCFLLRNHKHSRLLCQVQSFSKVKVENYIYHKSLSSLHFCILKKSRPNQYNFHTSKDRNQSSLLNFHVVCIFHIHPLQWGAERHDCCRRGKSRPNVLNDVN